MNFRGRTPVVSSTQGPAPGKGTIDFTPNFTSKFDGGGWESGEFDSEHGDRQYNHRVPKLDFPKFDGSDSQEWRMKCEHYFDVNNTFPGLWVRIATIYFLGRAASWLRSSRAHLRFPMWEDFCAAVSAKFDRDQHENLIRQMDSIKQNGTVWEFYERFDELMNQLLVYDPTLSSKYLTHRFTKGLRREIRNAVLLQRPKDLESALAVALLQEEVMENSPPTTVREFKKSDGSSSLKINGKGAWPLPLPPGKGGGVPVSNRADERRSSDTVRSPTSLTEKVSALKSYRRAQGLCYVCAEKWSPNHKCASSVQLNVVQELLCLFLEEDSHVESENAGQNGSLTRELMAISLQAVQGTEPDGTMRMLGQLQGKELLVLVDSGSSVSFISSQIAEGLTGIQPLSRRLSVRVANGETLCCGAIIPNCEWQVQGHKFQTTLRVLPITSYDMILGMDWLMKHSPMSVDWSLKTITLSLQGTTVTLQGVHSELAHCKILSANEMQQFQQRKAVAHMVQLCSITDDVEPETIPVPVQELMQEFTTVFAEPKGLPPTRPFDHSIPLLPGAQPINVRPYRYTPAQKG
ncbi:uncharacterized protein [Oryza sativa Japonica Group]|uniref:uncharacterized protein n=1 Tax=Oryza sativa subsp. japonica TaxID=39947 RepID=UPI0007754370|nr:uncharacterized protein LOC107279569 [Oryza sativa Japonica Group]